MRAKMFDEKKMTVVPKQSELYYWADYVELLCLTDMDGHFSAERLAQLAKFAEDFQATSPQAQDGDEDDIQRMLLEASEADILTYDVSDGTAVDSIDIPPEIVSDESTEGLGRAAEVHDNRYDWCGQVFALLADRQKALKAAYPFEVSSQRLNISLSTDLTDCRPYIFYLSCSSLSSMKEANARRLTAHFETVSRHVMKCLLPQRAEVEVFGTARDIDATRFTGSPFDRITALARELRGTVLVDRSEFHPNESGDNGLDLVAWLPMHDDAKGVPSFFGQCACGKKWDGKQYEASYERWGEFIKLSSPSTKFTFIPHYFRREGGAWYANADVSGILVDRLRAIRATSNDAAFVPSELVDEALKFRMSLT